MIKLFLKIFEPAIPYIYVCISTCNHEGNRNQEL